MAPLIVDNEAKLQHLLVHVTKRASGEHLLFIDLEGIDLGRNGDIAIMQLLMPPEPIVYLIDVHVLGSRAFNMTAEDPTGHNHSLKSILEDNTNTFFKVFFDVRSDSAALHAHFGIQVAGVVDLQILEYATRQPRGTYVNGLARCIERDLPYTTPRPPDWSVTKARGRRLFAPEVGGRYEVFLERPIPNEIVRYCEQDVLLMPHLLVQYGSKLHPRVKLAAQLQSIVDERIQSSQSTAFNGKGMHMAIGPSLAPERTQTSTYTSPEISLVCSPNLAQLCRLDNDDGLVSDLIGSFEAMKVEQQQAAIVSVVHEDSADRCEERRPDPNPSPGHDDGNGNNDEDVHRRDNKDKNDNGKDNDSGSGSVGHGNGDDDHQNHRAHLSEAHDFDHDYNHHHHHDDDDDHHEDIAHYFDADFNSEPDSASMSAKDFTACGSDCGYCGHCDY